MFRALISTWPTELCVLYMITFFPLTLYVNDKRLIMHFIIIPLITHSFESLCCIHLITLNEGPWRHCYCMTNDVIGK